MWRKGRWDAESLVQIHNFHRQEVGGIMQRTIARLLARDASWHKTTAAILLDAPFATPSERDRLVESWAALRDLAIASSGRRTDFPTHKAG
jgi:hypothetical protein